MLGIRPRFLRCCKDSWDNTRILWDAVGILGIKLGFLGCPKDEWDVLRILGILEWFQGCWNDSSDASKNPGGFLT